jgi:hypothetical protein
MPIWYLARRDGMNSTANLFSDDLRRFIGIEHWKFATTLPDWPHEYLVRERVDRRMFERVVTHIRSNGYEGRFYEREIRYYEEEELLYWTIGAPVEQTVIINRCRKEESLEARTASRHVPVNARLMTRLPDRGLAGQDLRLRFAVGE